jgi:glycosyltransferase A (GT-A) superfamily protein (DUF2064 family)
MLLGFPLVSTNGVAYKIPMPTKTKTRIAQKNARTTAARMTFAEAMHALEKAGSAQTRKTYARHGAEGPMFGMSFAPY